MTSVFDYDVDAVLARILESQAANDANYANQECLTSGISNISEISNDDSACGIHTLPLEIQEGDGFDDDNVGDVAPFEGHPDLVSDSEIEDHPWGNEDSAVESH